MDIESLREYCLSKPLATEDSAFGPDWILFRVYNKIFACLDLNRPDRVVLKLEPDYGAELRERYEGIVGAWHWNKRYWFEVCFDTDVSDALVLQLVDHSLGEVLKKLPRKLQQDYAAQS
ncbi:MAG: MmcQ/YjbR family DNA-binding protein [Bacteroidales bacterium]|nr:MmcQ/YjbR family DNA-binding protein [Bacteroidales bacterium]